MNNKGFMMAEVVVVSAIVLVALTGLYTSYNKIYSIYNTRINYYDVTTLYKLGYYRDNFVMNNSNYFLGSLAVISGTDSNEKVILIKVNSNGTIENQLTTVKNNIDSQTYKDYLDYISTSVSVDSNYVLTMERCTDSTKTDCKYAYLEVYDGNE